VKDDGWKQALRVGGAVWKRLKRAGGGAAESAQRTARIQALNAQIRKLSAEQRKVISDIGGKVYALHTKGKVRNQDVLESCQNIDRLMQQVAELKEQIEAIRAEGKQAGAVAELKDDGFLTDAPDTAEEQAVEVEIAEDAPEETQPERENDGEADPPAPEKDSPPDAPEAQAPADDGDDST